MKLLICTQAIDVTDPVLGFFVRWVEEFAKHCEEVTVICLKEGKHDLPANVRVHSLGKEQTAGSGQLAVGRDMLARLRYAARFYRLIWHFRHEYDAVFVHMNQEYVLLGGIFWRLWGKRVFMWRNHYAGSWLTRLAGHLCDTVFYTSRASYTAWFGNATQMPVGVDLARFSPEAATRVPRSILSLGRIAPSKKVDVLIEALGILAACGTAFTASIYGPETGNETYLARLRARVHELGLESRVRFGGAVAHDAAPALFAAHDIFVNLSDSGMYDKTLFEAAASGCLVLATSADFAAASAIPAVSADAEVVADRLHAFLDMHEEKKEAMHARLIELGRAHDLDTLADSLCAMMNRTL